MTDQQCNTLLAVIDGKLLGRFLSGSISDRLWSLRWVENTLLHDFLDAEKWFKVNIKFIGVCSLTSLFFDCALMLAGYATLHLCYLMSLARKSSPEKRYRQP